MTMTDEKESIDTSLNETYITKRVISEALEEILYEQIPVLDHGFIRVIDYMGNDSSIVQAARVSYGKGTKKVSEDRGLIFYLMRHFHTTPFEMCDIKFHIKLPIFVARQWIRHRTASVNEYSARYSILSREFYIPEQNHIAPQSNTNRQGRDDILNQEEAAKVLELLREDAMRCYDHYEVMLNHKEDGQIIDENNQGIARELARMNLNLNYYTEWYWKINLHNLMHFLRLRADSHAQYEIRIYAEKMLDIMNKWVPIAYESFMEYRMNSHNFSGKAIEIIKRMIKGEKPTYQEYNMSKREWLEIMNALEIAE